MYYNKYLKYKLKYMTLKGGLHPPIIKDKTYLDEYIILDENNKNNFVILKPKTNESLKLLVKINNINDINDKMINDLIHNVYILQKILKENIKIYNIYKINCEYYVEIEPVEIKSLSIEQNYGSLISFFVEYIPDKLLKKFDFDINTIKNIKNILNIKIKDCVDVDAEVLLLTGNVDNITEDFFKSFMTNIILNIKKYIPEIARQIAHIQYTLIMNGYKLKIKSYNSFGYLLLDEKIKIYLLDFENIEPIHNMDLQLSLINVLIDDISLNLDYSICNNDLSNYNLTNLFNNMLRVDAKMYSSNIVVQNILMVNIPFILLDTQKPILENLGSIYPLNNELLDELKTYLINDINPEHFNNVKVVEKDISFLENWKIKPNTGNNNCGFYTSEVYSDKILICRKNGDLTRLNPPFMQEITKVLHISEHNKNLITMYYNTYKINNKYYVECERMDGDLTSYFINHIPKTIAKENGHDNCNNISDILKLFESDLISELEFKNIIKKIVNEFKKFTEIMIKKIAIIIFEMLKLGYACSDNKLDNFGYTLTSIPNHPIIKIIDYGVVREIFKMANFGNKVIPKVDPYIGQQKILKNKYFIKSINELIELVNNNFKNKQLCMDTDYSNINNSLKEIKILQKYSNNVIYNNVRSGSAQVCFIESLSLPKHNFQPIIHYDEDVLQPFLEYIYS
jgi:hypothetical protein